MTAEQPQLSGDQDETLLQIAAVIATMGGEHPAGGNAVVSGENASVAELPPLRGQLERPDRRRYSSSESTETLSSGKDYQHEFWLPETRADGSEEPGHLRAVAYLDEKGHAARYGNAFDRYHFLTGAGLVDLKQAGFGPVLERLGFISSCTGGDRYWDRHCVIRLDYPSAATLCQRANEILAEQAARTGRQPLQLVNVPRGIYSSEFFVNMMAEHKYPLSQEYDTPPNETDQIERGSHDVLTHAVAAMILSGTSLFDDLVRRAQQLCTTPDTPDSERQRSSIRYYMGAADRAITVQTFADLLKGNREALLDLGKLIPFSGNRDSYAEKIRQQITNPREAGWLDAA
jgi:hypothetical protein